MRLKNNIPNVLTLGNLSLGIIGLVCVFHAQLEWAVFCIFASAILDFLDGFVARIIQAHSDMGKQLDSLADVVSFGVLPGMMVFQLFGISFGEFFTPIEERSTSHLVISGLSLLIPIFSAIRLAKFNIDEEQTTFFKGVPTPAVALFIASIVLLLLNEFNFNVYSPPNKEVLDFLIAKRKLSTVDFYLSSFMFSTWFYIVITVGCAFLLVAPFKFMAFKFKNFKVKSHLDKLALILLSGLAIGYFAYKNSMYVAFPLIFILYLVLSIFGNFSKKQAV